MATSEPDQRPDLVIDARTDQEDETTARVRVVGELDMRTSAELRARLAEIDAEGFQSIVLDLSDVPFIDSGGIGVLVGALRRAEQRGATVSVAAAHRNVRDVFGVTHLSQTFGIDAAV